MAESLEMLARQVGGVQELGFSIFDSMEADAVEAIADTMNYKAAYPDWPFHPYGFTDADAATIFGKYRFYVRNKNIGAGDFRGIYKQIATDLGITSDTKRRSVLSLLMELPNITNKKKWREYFQGQSVGTEVVADKIQQAAKKGMNVGTAVVQAASNVESLLPWYMKPKLLLLLAAGVGVGYIAIAYGGAGKAIKGAAGKAYGKYLKNPIERKDLKKPSIEEKTEKLYNAFHQRPVKRRKSLKLPDTAGLVELGEALEIGYRSDKYDGKKKNYLHKFGKGVKIYSTADAKGLLICGGKMEVQDVGIVN